MNKTLMIVDDDLPFRERLSRSMEKKDFQVEAFADCNVSLKRIADKKFDYAIVDMRLKDGSGLELIKKIREISPNTKALLLTGYGNIATAVAAIKSGAIDYLPKPAEIDQIFHALTNSKEILPANTNQAVAIISLNINTVSPNWVVYCFNSSYLDSFFENNQVMSAQANLSLENLGNIPLVIPSLIEGKQIEEFLEKQTTQFDELIAKSKTQITLLEEKRQALITAAVTGKIDVRSEAIA